MYIYVYTYIYIYIYIHISGRRGRWGGVTKAEQSGARAATREGAGSRVRSVDEIWRVRRSHTTCSENS